MPIDPITGLTLAQSAAELTRKLYEVAKGLKDREAKQQLDELLDRLRELKQQASDLEDENRELREKLRFNSDEFDFRNPFYYEKKHPDRPLYPKCFANQIPAPMSEPYDASGVYRKCLACGTAIEEMRGARFRPNPLAELNRDE